MCDNNRRRLHFTHRSKVRLFPLCLQPICMDAQHMHLNYIIQTWYRCLPEKSRVKKVPKRESNKKTLSLIWLRTEIHVGIYWLHIPLGYLKHRHFRRWVPTWNIDNGDWLIVISPVDTTGTDVHLQFSSLDPGIFGVFSSTRSSGLTG